MFYERILAVLAAFLIASFSLTFSSIAQAQNNQEYREYFDVAVPDSETSFQRAAICYGIYSQYYRLQLTLAVREGEEFLDRVGQGIVLRMLRSWEKALVDRLPDQSEDVQQNYPQTISTASQALIQVVNEEGMPGVQETLENECEIYISSQTAQGLDPLDAGVTYPLIAEARDLSSDQMTTCLGLSEMERVVVGPSGVVSTNGFRQLYADWMAEGGFSTEEVAMRTDENAVMAFEQLFKQTIRDELDGAAATASDDAVALCVPYLQQ